MRVLFVFPDLSSTVTNYTGVLSYGVGLLAAVLRRDGHDVSLYHIITDPTEEEFCERIRAARPDLVAFSAISHYARRLRTWSTWAHQATGAPVVIGGVHATHAPEEVSSMPDVHFTCVGEGEDALCELCNRLERGGDPTRVGGFWARSGDEVIRNPPRTIIDDLDSLPDPDLSIFDVPSLYTSRQGLFTYLMSRGCAFRCTYCSAHTLMRVAPRTGKFWRFLSPERAADQIARLIRTYLPTAKVVSFSDAIFIHNQKWLADFAPLYKERVGLPVSCNMRADMVKEGTAELLRDLGVKTVRMGVESGNQHMTRDVLLRNLDVADLRTAYRRLRDVGIERWSYNIVGLPTETLPMALETVRFNAEIDPELALAFIFYPYPGTDLHRLCKEKGMLTDREYDHYKVGVTIKQPQFADGDILFMHRYFKGLIRLYQSANRLPGPFARIAPRVLDAVITSPLLPRGAIGALRDVYQKVRHAAGEQIVARSPRLYRILGGTAPAQRVTPASLEGLARADA
jgi:anaerobic magnesium-protoporphyrin IX monomethyl ester cyclase